MPKTSGFADREVENDPWDDHPEVSDRPQTSDRQVNSDRPQISDPQSGSLRDRETETSDRPEVSDRQEPVSKMKQEFQNCNNEGLKPLSDIELVSPQTLQKKLDPPYQSDGG